MKDCDMMKNFMTSGSPTRGWKLEEDPGGSNTTPFPREDAVMMVYDGCPPPGRHRVSNLTVNLLRLGTWGHRGVKEKVFQHIYIYVCVCVCIICKYVYYSFSKREKK
jgi:hypothetical protein